MVDWSWPLAEPEKVRSIEEAWGCYRLPSPGYLVRGSRSSKRASRYEFEMDFNHVRSVTSRRKHAHELECDKM